MPGEIKEHQTLISDGPYGWVRHPMYSTLFVWTAAYFLMSANALIGLAWLGLSLMAAAMVGDEEAALVETFGVAYHRYRESIGRFWPRGLTGPPAEGQPTNTPQPPTGCCHIMGGNPDDPANRLEKTERWRADFHRIFTHSASPLHPSRLYCSPVKPRERETLNSKVKIIAVGPLVVIAAFLLSACGVVRPPITYPPASPPGYSGTPAPAYGYGYGPGGMMGSGHMGGGMMGGGMMGGYGFGQSAPTAEPTPVGATPIPVDEEIQITALSLRFTPAEITIKPGETVRFVVTNDDPYLHNFVSQEAGIPFLNLPGNTTQTVTWTAPARPGAYIAVCTLHPGMSVNIVVED